MTIVVENGTIVAGAQSYIDLTFTEAYWETHGEPDKWNCQDEVAQEAAILYATKYLETRYKFKGHIVDETQALSFPRSSFCDSEGRDIAGTGVIPEPIKEAVAELALRHVIRDLFLDNSPESRAVSRNKIADSEVELGNTRDLAKFKYINLLLRDYIASDDSCMKITRA